MQEAKGTGGFPAWFQGQKAPENATVSVCSGAGGGGARGHLGSHVCACHPAVAAGYMTYVCVSLTRVKPVWR